MSILTFPTLSRNRGPQLAEWWLAANTQTQTSPFDKTTQTIAMPGQRWRGSFTWSDLPASDHRLLGAWLAALGGSAGRFYFSPPQGWRRASAVLNAATTKVSLAGQSGSILAADGFPLEAIIFEVGDYISFPNSAGRPQLHVVTDQTWSNSSGEASIPIAPPLRGAPPDDAAIAFNSPVGVFMLVDDEQGHGIHSGDKPDRASFSIDIIEALA